MSKKKGGGGGGRSRAMSMYVCMYVFEKREGKSVVRGFSVRMDRFRSLVGR